MSIFSFVKEAGEKITDFIEGNGKTEDAIKARIKQLGLPIENLVVDVKDDVATLTGTASSSDVFEKAILAAGNIKGIANVNSSIKVNTANNPSSENSATPSNQSSANATSATAPASPAANAGNTSAAESKQPTFYRVKSGDTLSKISKHFYGDANKYNKIFEANKPMLKSPDAIYPDQTLRIPDMDMQENKAA